MFMMFCLISIKNVFLNQWHVPNLCPFWLTKYINISISISKLMVMALFGNNSSQPATKPYLHSIHFPSYICQFYPCKIFIPSLILAKAKREVQPFQESIGGACGPFLHSLDVSKRAGPTWLTRGPPLQHILSPLQLGHTDSDLGVIRVLLHPNLK